jgi:hypothetical protein
LNGRLKARALSPTRGAIAFLILLALSTGLACRGGNDSSRKESAIPIPHVKPIGKIRFDKKAWIDYWRHFPGPYEPNCVNVGRKPSVRSGQFVVGNFAAYIESWDGSPENSKLAYTPLYPDSLSTLTVVARKIGNAAEPITFQFSSIAWTPGGMPFYVSGTVLPERGRWRLEATAGRNRGCFEFTL